MFKRAAQLIPHPYVFVFFLIAFGFLYYNSSPLLFDPDVPWHIAAGDVIRTTGEIPTTDPWSYSAGDYQWYNISWSWDLLISYVTKYTGYEGLYSFSVLCTAFIIAFLGYSLFSRKNLHEDSISIAVCLAGLVLWHSMFARPHLVTFAMVLFFNHLLYHSRQNPERLYPYFVLPILMVFWVNSHGGFLAGFVIIGAYALEAYISRDYCWLKRLIFSGILTFIALFSTPYGIGIVEAVLRTLFSSITVYIREWHSFRYGDYFGLSVFFLAFLFSSNFKDNDIPLADKILAAIWLLAALISVRNFAIFSLLAAPYLAQRLQCCITLHPHDDVDTTTNKVRLFIASIVVSAAFFVPQIQYHLNFKDVVYSETRTAFDAVDFIANEYPDVRFMNDYDIGGYIVLRAPDTPIFSDGRAGTAYPEHVLSQMITFHTLENGWQKLLDDYEVNGLIVRPDKALPQSFYETWSLEYESPAANVLIRKSTIK